MEINDFDKIIKEQMRKLEITPSSGAKRRLAFILFFSNVLVFHKMKFIAALFLMSGGVYIGLNYFSNDKDSIVQNSSIEKPMQNSFIAENEKGLIKDENPENEELDIESENREYIENNSSEQSSSTSKDSSIEKYSEVVSAIPEDNKIENQKSLSSAEPNDVEDEVNNNLENSDSKMMVNEEKNGSSFIEKTSSNEHNTEDNLENNSSKESNNLIVKEEIIEKVAIISAGIETKIELDNSFPEMVVVPTPDDYVNEPKKRGLTLDGYLTPIYKVDIDNELDESLSQYYWDFYEENGYKNSGLNGGLNINYNWNNFKIGTGFQIASLRDFKSKYKHFYLPDFLGIYGGEPISGAVVYGQDTSLVFYTDPLNNKLGEELEAAYNTYTYLKIPLTLGYELDFNYLSFELNGGIEYARMIKAKGVEVKSGSVNTELASVYFYSDKYMDLMTRKSENLNKNQFAVLGNATLRIRLTPSFDLYSSFNYSQSLTSINSDEYFLQKRYKNYGLKFGVTYYLNKRLKLNEKQAIGF